LFADPEADEAGLPALRLLSLGGFSCEFVVDEDVRLLAVLAGCAVGMSLCSSSLDELSRSSLEDDESDSVLSSRYLKFVVLLSVLSITDSPSHLNPRHAIPTARFKKSGAS
jgi:hypothetical protein